MENILTKSEAYQKTLDAIALEHDQSVYMINDLIKTAANDMKTEITITEEDMLPLDTQFGIRMKKLFVSLGYDVKFLTNNGYKLIISWDNKC